MLFEAFFLDRSVDFVRVLPNSCVMARNWHFLLIVLTRRDINIKMTNVGYSNDIACMVRRDDMGEDDMWVSCRGGVGAADCQSKIIKINKVSMGTVTNCPEPGIAISLLTTPLVP